MMNYYKLSIYREDTNFDVGNVNSNLMGWRTKLKLLALLAIISVFGVSGYGQLSTYTFASSSGTFTAISGGTTIASSASQDTWASSLVNIGFTFNFDGTDYTQFCASSNGSIRLGATSFSTTPISTAGNGPSIAFMARDAKTSTTGVSYLVSGSAPNRVLTIEYLNFQPHWSSTTEKMNVQVILYETTNVVQIVYGACSATTSRTGQVGLVSTATTNYSNRTSTTSWSASAAGSTNTSTMTFSSTVLPSSGLTYTWTPPSCVAPSVSNTTSITTTSATINWTAQASATSGYDYEVRTSGAAGSGATGLVASGSVGAGVTSANISSLTANTSYSVYVRSNCGSGTFSSWTSGSGAFTTLCNAISTFPYTEGFEGLTAANTLPSCMVSSPTVAASGKVQTYIAAATGTNSALSARTGTKFAAVYWSPSATAGYVFSAPLQLTAGSSYTASVWYKTDGVGWTDATLSWGTSATPVAMTNTIATVSNAIATVYTQITGTFTVPTTGVYYVSFRGYNATTSPNYIAFDDFTVDVLPACTGTPNNGALTISSASGCNGTSILLSPTGLSNGTGITYQWQTSTDNTNWNDIVGANGSTYNLTTLSGLNYYRIATTCSSSSSTSNSNSVSYTGANCTYNSAYSTGATFTSIMPANGGSGLVFPSWQSTSGDDNTSNTVSLAGTTFAFQGTPVTGFQACSNGWMTFNTSNTSTAYANGLTATTPIKVLAPFWDDLVFTGQTYANRDSCLRYQVSGTLGSGSAVITIEWAGLERFNIPGPNLNFQVKLYESGNVIEYIYGNFEGYDGTLGTSGYSYSMGMNGASPGGTTFVDRMALQVANANYFSATTDPANLIIMPVCYSKYTFTPGTYAGLTSAPAAVIPSNDNSAAAITLPVTTLPATAYCGTYYTSLNATNSGTGQACATTSGNEDDDVWFKFNTTVATSYTIKVRPAANYDAVVQILDASLTPIACINAATAGLTETLNASGLTSGGTTYYVRVFHNGTNVGTSSGEFSIAINEVINPPTNDSITTATSLSSASGTCTPTSSQYPETLSATSSVETNVLTVSAGTPDDDVWYSFVASSVNQTVTVVSGTGYNAQFELYSSSDNTAMGTLTRITNQNSTSTGGTETYTGTTFVIGNTYFVRVYHSTTGAGTANFTICVTQPLPACTTNTAPANNATNVSLTPTLTWASALYATSYDVYLGTTSGGETLLGNATTTSYVVSTPLSSSTQYFWYVVPKNAVGSPTCGVANETSFTTQAVCTGTPTAGTATASTASICLSGTTTLTLAGYTVDSGITLQWHDNSGAISGANSATYTTPTLTSSNSYFCVVTCTSSSMSVNSNTVAITVNSPSIGSTTPASRCGVGTVTLGATGSTGATLNWYAAATGGSSLGTGTSFTTPSISASTDYYVEAVSGETSLSGGGKVAPESSWTGSTFNNYGIIFTANSNVKIDSVDLYSSAAGTVVLKVVNSSNVELFATTSIAVSNGGTTTPTTVPINYTLPSAGTYKILVKSYSGVNLLRGSTSLAFPYTNSNISVTASEWGGSTTGTYYYMYNIKTTSSCASARTSVTATVTPAPALTLSSASIAICQGTTSTPVTVTSTVSDYDTYTWTPSTGVSGSAASGYTFNPSATTAYVLTATNSTTGCAAIPVNFSVTVNPVPTAVTVSSSSSVICSDNTNPTYSTLTASGGEISNNVLFTEGFDSGLGSFTATNTSTSGTPANAAWANRANAYSYNSESFSSNNASNFVMSNSDSQGSGGTTATTLVSPVFSLVGYTAPSLKFYHYYKYNGSPETAKVQISTDGGTTFTTDLATYTTSQGASSSFAAVTIDLSAYAGQSNLKIRFKYDASYDWYWAIDNVSVSGTYKSIAWSPTTGLFTDSGCTVAYTGQNLDTVYAKPAATATYIATSTTSAGCSKQASTTVTVINCLSSQVRPDLCGLTKSMEDWLYVTNAVAPTGSTVSYMIEATNLTTNAVVTITKPNVYFKFSELSNADYGSPMSIRVKVVLNGSPMPSFGTACTVTVASTTVNTQIGSTTCGTRLGELHFVIPVVPICKATSYTVEVSRLDSSNAVVETVTYTTPTSYNAFALTDITGLTVAYDTSYSIRVKANTVNGTSNYGSSCIISTRRQPSLTITSGCNTQMANSGVRVYSSSVVSYGLSYRFYLSTTPLTLPSAGMYVTNLTGSAIVINTHLNLFTFSQATGYVPNTAYYVLPVIVCHGKEILYGTSCTITSSATGGTSTAIASETNPTVITKQVAPEFNVVAYPNPFDSSYKLNMTTVSEEVVSVKVYDMLGKQVEDKNISVSDLEVYELGNNLPSGVYNVIVSQGTETKTIRVIKK